MYIFLVLIFLHIKKINGKMEKWLKKKCFVVRNELKK